MVKRVLLVYFSGTGGTKRIADCFEEKFLDNKCGVIKHSLEKNEYESIKENYNGIISDIDLIVLLYPVYAMDAPILVYEWIKNLKGDEKIPTVVISVSGGGDVWPNTSCRVNIIKALENKNFDVIYEKMMIMPANIFVPLSDHLVMHLLNCIPDKVTKIVSDVLDGKKHRDGIHLTTHFFSMLHLGKKAKDIGKSLKVKDNCSACGWCAANCPRGNLKMEGSKPEFGNSCIGCFRCIYGCPNKSIYLKKGNKLILKNGFNIKEVEKRMEGVQLEPVEKCCKGLFMIGVRKYLLGN